MCVCVCEGGGAFWEEGYFGKVTCGLCVGMGGSTADASKALDGRKHGTMDRCARECSVHACAHVVLQRTHTHPHTCACAHAPTHPRTPRVRACTYARSGYCTHTKDSEAGGEWWEIDLATKSKVDKVLNKKASNKGMIARALCKSRILEPPQEGMRAAATSASLPPQNTPKIAKASISGTRNVVGTCGLASCSLNKLSTLAVCFTTRSLSACGLHGVFPDCCLYAVCPLYACRQSKATALQKMLYDCVDLSKLPVSCVVRLFTEHFLETSF